MRMWGLILSVAVLACAPVALAQIETPPPPAVESGGSLPPAEVVADEQVIAEEQAEATADPELVCRTIERSESRLRSRRERVCRTQAEWDATRQNRRGGQANDE
jgi:hypothetical protein